jgi:hypothetical protein
MGEQPFFTHCFCNNVVGEIDIHKIIIYMDSECYPNDTLKAFCVQLLMSK